MNPRNDRPLTLAPPTPAITPGPHQDHITTTPQPHPDQTTSQQHHDHTITTPPLRCRGEKVAAKKISGQANKGDQSK